MGKALGDGLIERLCERLRERLRERLGEMLRKRLCKMMDPNMIQVYFRQASSRIQESLYLSQLPSPDEGLVYKRYDMIHKMMWYTI